MNKHLAKEAGLEPLGIGDEGEMEYLGTQKQWAEYGRLETAEENEQRMESIVNQEIDYGEPKE